MDLLNFLLPPGTGAPAAAGALVPAPITATQATDLKSVRESTDAKVNEAINSLAGLRRLLSDVSHNVNSERRVAEAEIKQKKQERELRV